MRKPYFGCDCVTFGPENRIFAYPARTFGAKKRFLCMKSSLWLVLLVLLGALSLTGCSEKDLKAAKAQLRASERANEALRIHNDSLQRYIDRYYDRASGAPAPPAMPVLTEQGTPAPPTTSTPDTALQRLLLSAGRELIVREGQFHLVLPDDQLFGNAGRTLTTEGQRQLAALAGVLKQVRGYRLLVESHTDNAAISGQTNIADGWDLSALRAAAVAKALETLGVPGYLLLAAGRGPSQPLAPNDTEPNRARNRRTEIVLVKK